jgi:hypothetical protein
MRRFVGPFLLSHYHCFVWNVWFTTPQFRDPYGLLGQAHRRADAACSRRPHRSDVTEESDRLRSL